MNRMQFTSSVHSLFIGKTFAERSAITSDCIKPEAHVGGYAEEAAEGRPSQQRQCQDYTMKLNCNFLLVKSQVLIA